jgi:hypothetical protein
VGGGAGPARREGRRRQAHRAVGAVVTPRASRVTLRACGDGQDNVGRVVRRKKRAIRSNVQEGKGKGSQGPGSRLVHARPAANERAHGKGCRGGYGQLARGDSPNDLQSASGGGVCKGREGGWQGIGESAELTSNEHSGGGTNLVASVCNVGHSTGTPGTVVSYCTGGIEATRTRVARGYTSYRSFV